MRPALGEGSRRGVLLIFGPSGEVWLLRLATFVSQKALLVEPIFLFEHGFQLFAFLRRRRDHVQDEFAERRIRLVVAVFFFGVLVFAKLLIRALKLFREDLFQVFDRGFGLRENCFQLPGRFLLGGVQVVEDLDSDFLENVRNVHTVARCPRISADFCLKTWRSWVSSSFALLLAFPPLCGPSGLML